ncbi:MAG TPA: TIM44-like domain-containing protein [Steroidobacteraceae bacterium]|nr:TIM44-like domain-containing protein [Steroidobacteraceae bacterium]
MRRSTALAAGWAITAVGAAGKVLGRAGGGGHSGGSSAHASGGHTVHLSGGSGGSLSGVIAVLILVFVILYLFRRMGRRAPTPAMRASPAGSQAVVAAIGAAIGAAAMRRSGGEAALSAPFAPSLPAAIDEIRKIDPLFELELFLQRAEMVFFLVKRGIQHNDPAAIRPYLSDAVFAAVSNSITLAETRHQHALLESLNVRALHIDSAQCDASGQRIQVHFDLVYRAKLLDDANRVLSDEGADQRHGERWSFTRAAAARTPVNGGVVAVRCPVCGAELRLGLDGTCAHCRASITNGTVDWVVAAVESAPFIGYSGGSPFGVTAASVAEGISRLRATDPSFAMDAFQGRVKAAFLTLQDAWCRQNLDAGRAFLSPGAYFSWRAQLETMTAEGRRNVMEQLSVRGIEPLQIVHGRVFDDLTVRITACAADFEVDRENRIVFGDRTVRPFTEDWTFQRSVGVATTQKPGTLENTCPRCGAPLVLNQIGECRYCKAAVTSGKFDWVVSRIEQDEGLTDVGLSLQSIGSDLVQRAGAAAVVGLLSSLIDD